MNPFFFFLLQNLVLFPLDLVKGFTPIPENRRIASKKTIYLAKRGIEMSARQRVHQQPLTPKQIKLLRKEAGRRRSRKTLFQVWIPEEVQQDEKLTLESIESMTIPFSNQELIEVRGVSKNTSKDVHQVLVDLAECFGEHLERPVYLVDWAGHAGIFFSSNDSVDGDEKIVLRSSYKDDVWKKRQKPELPSGRDPHESRC